MRALVLISITVALAAPVRAQQAPPAGGTASANPISDGIRSQWNSVKRYLRESAEQMPEDTYNFKPTPDVRSFGAILAHVAGASYAFCGASKAEKAPFAEDSFEGKATTKEAISKAVNDSIAYCDGAYTALTDATAGQMVPNPFGQGQMVRAAALVGNIGHDNEHYGNLVTYFRLKGMVPPSSKKQ